MVYYEVTGLYKMFEELGAMESTGWQALPPSPKKQKLQVSVYHCTRDHGHYMTTFKPCTSSEA